MDMRDERQACADQILKEIDYGRLPAAEIEKRLQAMIDEALSGPAETEKDSVRAELCNSLLWQLYTQGQVCAADPLPEADSRTLKDRITEGYLVRKHRRRKAMTGMAVMAAVLVLAVGLSALNILPGIPWLTDSAVPSETGNAAGKHRADLSLGVISHAIAEHMESGQQQLTTSDSSAYADFLGFDPGVPETLCGTYTAADYQAMVEPTSITLSIPYRMDSAEASGGEQFNLSMTLLNSAEPEDDFEDQIEGARVVDIQGTPVYECSDIGHGYYIWNKDQVIYLLVMRESITNEEDVLNAIVAKMQD